MALEMEQLKKIDKRTQFTVFGFVRDAQILLPSIDNPYYIIPDLVTYVVLNFYYQREFWYIVAQGFELSNHERTVTNTNARGWNNMSYVNVEVNSMEKCVAKWYIRIDKAVSRHVMLGIIGRRITTDAGLFQPFDYGYWSSNGQTKSLGGAWRRYGARYEDNDEICCVLDLKKKEISWDKNGIKQGIASSNITCGVDIIYRLGISMYFKGSKCTIIRFERE